MWKYQLIVLGFFVILNFCWCWNLNLKQFSNCGFDVRICILIKTKMPNSNPATGYVWFRFCVLFILLFLTAEEWPPPNVAIYHSITVLGWLPLSSMVYITSNSVISKGQSQQNSDRDVDSERWLSVCQRFWFKPLVWLAVGHVLRLFTVQKLVGPMVC